MKKSKFSEHQIVNIKEYESGKAIKQTWSIDFMNDSLANGRRFSVLNVMDDYNRKSLINEAFYSSPVYGWCKN